jgi:hypothetical protein
MTVAFAGMAATFAGMRGTERRHSGSSAGMRGTERRHSGSPSVVIPAKAGIQGLNRRKTKKCCR